MLETSLSFLDQLQHEDGSRQWERLVALYSPVLRSWLRRYDDLTDTDREDLVQETLLAVSQEFAKFKHNQKRGAFRNWLKTILIHRLRHFFRSRQHRPAAVGGSDFQDQLDQLEDGASQISQIWDREHDRHVMNQLLQMAQPRFADNVWQAFDKQVNQEMSTQMVADELGMTLTAVYAAKSRVLSTLRAMAEGLVD